MKFFNKFYSLMPSASHTHLSKILVDIFFTFKIFFTPNLLKKSLYLEVVLASDSSISGEDTS